MADAPVTIFREIGSTGLKLQAGNLYEEFRKEISGISGVELFREMAMNNAVVGAILFVIQQVIQQTEWMIKPFEEKNNEDEKNKEFISECMFQDMNVSFPDVLSEITTFILYGWSYLEVCYKKRLGLMPTQIGALDPAGNLIINPNQLPGSKFTDRKTGWRKWALRGQETLYKWEMDDNQGIAGMTQYINWPNSDTRTIPISKALLFRTKVEKGSPEGQSILRTAYTSYWYLKRYQESEAIGIERDLAGLPTITTPENLNLWNEADPVMVTALRAAERLVTSLRRGEKEGVVIPFGWTLELLASPSRRTFDIDATIQRLETRIAMSCLADFIFLGSSSSSGSWALSSDKTEMFILALKGFLTRIKEVVNRHAIPVLMELNGMDSSRPPQLDHGAIETQDLQKLGQFITAMTTAGAITFPDDALSDHLRAAAKLPEAPDEPLPPIEDIPPKLTNQQNQQIQKLMGEVREIIEGSKIYKNNGHAEA